MPIGPSIQSLDGGSGGGAVVRNDTSGDKNDIYTVTPENWYKPLPYGFSFFDRSATRKSTSIFYLPILPSNINVTTHFATNIVTTLFGVVEEHSEIRYYDIEIAGTTGIAPKYIEAKQQGVAADKVTSDGRTIESNPGIDLGGFLPEVTNTINQVKNLASDIGNAVSGGGAAAGTGVNVNKTGYMAFHNFYRFLQQYKKDAAGISKLGNTKRNHHPLQFLNYKDGIKYDCAIQTFTLTRSADNPMFYNYNIKLHI